MPTLVQPRGREDAPYVFVGNAPNESDIANGYAWSDPALVAVMEDLLERRGIKESDVVYLNAVSFPKRSVTKELTADDINTDAAKYLLPFIALYPRKLIIAFGNEALCALGVVPKPEKVKSLRSKPLESEALKERGVTCALACTPHPWSVLKEPDENDELWADISFAFKLSKSKTPLIFQRQEPMTIMDMEAPEQVELLHANACASGLMSYDFETTGKNPRQDFPVSMSAYTGIVTPNNESEVWWWAGYDRLKPRFNEKTMNGFHEKLGWLLSRAGKDYDLIAWNGNFDDWVADVHFADVFEKSNTVFEGAQFDAMLMKWQVRNKRPSDLKTCTARDLGYPNYDAVVDDDVKEIADRRGKILKHDDDLYVLDYFGFTPIKAKTGVKWPTVALVAKCHECGFQNNKGERICQGCGTTLLLAADKKLAAWAMIPYEDLRQYGCYDALYTYRLFQHYGEIIDREGLDVACDLRHRIRKELLRCMQRGMLGDRPTIVKYANELRDIEEKCQVGIQKSLSEMGFDLPDFNPNSGPQLTEVLFGQPIEVPFFAPGTIVSKEMSWPVAQDRCQVIEEKLYGDDYQHIREAIKETGSFDKEAAEKRLLAAYIKKYPWSKIPQIEHIDMYLGGPHEPLGFTKTGKPSTGSSILQSINEAHPSDFLSLVLMLRRVSKLRGTFVEGILSRLDIDDVLRAHFNVIGTETGRISSSDPNGQNFVKYLRGQLIPRKGYRFLEWDLSQAEIRAVAAYSGDEDLIAALDTEDIHTTIASMIFNIPIDKVDKDTHRKYAKTIIFGIIYGMGPFRLGLAIGKSTQEAEEFIAAFFARFPKLKAWLDRQIVRAGRHPYYVYTPWGTRRSTLNIKSVDHRTRQHTERIACNMPIQGAAGELTLFYICEIMDRVRAAGYDCHLVNTTHDSCTLEVAEYLLEEIDGKPAGPIVEIVNEVIDNSVLPAPLDTVRFVADLEINDHWSGRPNLHKAIDPKDKLRWDLLNPEENLSADELAELLEAEEVALGA